MCRFWLLERRIRCGPVPTIDELLAAAQASIAPRIDASAEAVDHDVESVVVCDEGYQAWRERPGR
jgi:hypothetical protein